MILEILKENPLPKKQQGETTFFKRRKPYMYSIYIYHVYFDFLDMEGGLSDKETHETPTYTQCRIRIII